MSFISCFDGIIISSIFFFFKFIVSIRIYKKWVNVWLANSKNKYCQINQRNIFKKDKPNESLKLVILFNELQVKLAIPVLQNNKFCLLSILIPSLRTTFSRFYDEIYLSFNSIKLFAKNTNYFQQPLEWY